MCCDNLKLSSTFVLSNSPSNSSNMTPKLKVTPSAIILTKKEAATTTQPYPPSGAE